MNKYATTENKNSFPKIVYKLGDMMISVPQFIVQDFNSVKHKLYKPKAA